MRDARGEIELLKPGRGVLTARGGAKVLEWFEREGEVAAGVRREMYVRVKRR